MKDGWAGVALPLHTEQAPLLPVRLRFRGLAAGAAVETIYRVAQRHQNDVPSRVTTIRLEVFGGLLTGTVVEIGCSRPRARTVEATAERILT